MLCPKQGLLFFTWKYFSGIKYETQKSKHTFLCLHAGDSHGQRRYILRLFIYPSVQFFQTRNLGSALRELIQIWHKYSHGVKEELMRFWWSKVNGSKISMIIMTKLNTIV